MPRIEKTPVRLTQILLTLSICSLAAALLPLLPLGTIAAESGAGDKQQEKGPSLPSEIPDSFTRTVGFDACTGQYNTPSCVISGSLLNSGGTKHGSLT
jgi:hypothetical protein